MDLSDEIDNISSGKRQIYSYLKYRIQAQGPLEMCLSLEHQNLSKPSEKMGYFDRVTISLHILYTANQETEGS